MARKALQKNLSYDDQRNIFYVPTNNGSRRQSRTYHTYTEALAALYPAISLSGGTNGQPLSQSQPTH